MKLSVLLLIIVSLITSCSSNDRSENFTQVESTLKTPAGSWLGAWERRLWGYGATLEISNIKNDSVVFLLIALNGAHGGELEGTAVFRDSIAIFYTATEYDTCLIEFKLIGDTSIIIEQKKGLCYAGMGVTYDGEYKNLQILPKAEEETLLSLGIFETEKEDSLFKVLVGENYALFVYSTQTTSEDEDLDDLHSKVYSSGVTGLYTISENIIMVDSLNSMWAAVLYEEKVYYFTNSSKYKKELPQTIENWRQRFDDYPIVFN